MYFHKITTPKTLKITSFGNPEKAKIGIIALHGYGQLVQFFIRKFYELNPDEVFVIAPEGMHRFYLKGSSGRVGASWMTKEERLDDIQDNMIYLDKVYNQFLEPHNFENLVVLGFSQGAATAARWIEHSKVNFTSFIQWAGVFPPDLKLDLSKEKFNKTKHFYVVGNQDPYFKNEEYEKSQKSWLTQQGLSPYFVEFDGVHDLNINCLQSLLFDRSS